MGTSTAHPSPRDRAWNEVRELYRIGATPRAIAGAVARAVPDSTVSALVSSKVCSVEPVVARAWGDDSVRIVEALEEEHAIGHTVVEELARTAAVRTTLLAGASGPVSDWLTQVRTFACEFLAASFEYLVARDIVDYVGTEALPDIAAMASVIEAVADEARAAGHEAAAGPIAAPEVPEALTAAVRARAVAAVMTGAFAIMRTRGPADA